MNNIINKGILPLLFMSIVGVLATNAQPFLKNNKGRALTFKEMQLQYSQFKNSNDLATQKYWKHFKRYEADMQLHTNTQGEPAGFDIYIEEAIKAAEARKSSAATSAPWYPVGPNAIPNNLTGYMENGIGRINCVAFHPTNTSVFYVGVAQGGIWKTSNGGTSYTPLTDNLPITRVSDICIDPNNTNTIYASICDFEYIGKGLFLDGRKRHTHYGLGVYKSNDGGQNWSATGLTYQLTNGDGSLIRKILVNPSNSQQVLACGVSGMYKSSNGGTTWNKILDSLFWDMVQDPVNPSTIYAATGWVKNANMGYAGIYKSTDFGGSWTLLSTGMAQQGTVQRIKLAIAPGDHNYIYALCCDNTDGFYGVFKSTNAGSTWTYYLPQLNILEAGTGNSSGGQGPYDLALLVSAADKNTIYAGGVNLWGSSDGGITFNPISHWTQQYGTNTIHGDIHFMDRQPGTGNIFVCSDGGIYKTANLQIGSYSTPWTTNWTNLSNGMQCTSFYRLSSSKNNKGRLVAGAQDNASFYYNGNSWSTIFGGDGMDNYLDPLNHQDILGSSQYGNFYYSNDDGNTGWVVNSNPNNEAAEWVTPIAADYKHPGVLYLGNEQVYKATDGGHFWAQISNIPNNSLTNTSTEISAICVSPANGNVVWAARRVRYELGMNGVVIKTTNGGSNWSNVTAGLPDSLYFTGIEASPSNSNEAVVCLAGFSAGRKVFKTSDGGNTWNNISFNLPNVPVNCIKYASEFGTLVVATDMGVFTLATGSGSWTNYSNGLPNVIISDIEFNPALNKVYVSTFGRGIWESDMSMIVGLKTNGNGLSFDFKAYPSVGDGQITLECDPEKLPCLMDVFDINGRIIYSKTIVDTKTELRLKTPPGAYYLRLKDDQLLGVKKLIIE